MNAENFIGNRIESCLDLIGPDKKTLRDKYDIGEPRECSLGSSEEMKRLGYVGIYERENNKPSGLHFFNNREAK